MTRITLTGYSQTGSYLSPRINVMSIAAYEALDNILISGELWVLQGLLSASTPPPAYGTNGSGWVPPILPIGGGMPSFFAQYGLVPFVDGSGIRFLTLLTFEAQPINNNDMFYTYQGLTSDGQYWVSAFLPIHNTALVANGSTLPAGYATWNDFWTGTGYDAHITGTVATLNTQPPGTFDPLIEDLDDLVSSITFVP